MRVKILWAAIGLMLMILSVANAVPVKLDWKKEVNHNQCDTTGKPVINVEEKVLNDVDSGFGGNNWAFDNYNRQIQVWKQTDGTYCAVVSYHGKFDGQAGQTAPNGTGTLNGNENGAFEGGYRAIITGNLIPAPSLPTKGSIGTFDYQCPITASDPSTDCPEYFSWPLKYFTDINFVYSWWGWIYNGGKCGTWINSIDGSPGNILC